MTTWDVAERVRLADVTPPIPLGPLDGRYRPVVAPLVDHLSEPALNRERVHVEVEWLIHLTSHHVLPGAPVLSAQEQDYLRNVVATFGPDEIAELAGIERITQHDVKAVEYFVKARLAAAPAVLGESTVLASVGELVHFACTSEDINNLSYALLVRSAVQQVWLPAARALVDQLAALARDNADVAMLALTHGQPATPTTLGKEIAVFAHRLRRQLRRVEDAEYLGKLNGATGTYGAHLVAVPDADWQAVSRALRRAPGSDLEPADHADRVARLAVGAVRGRGPVQPDRCTTSPPTCGATSPAGCSSRCRWKARPARRRCRTRSTRSGSRTPRPTSSCPAPCWTRWPPRW